MSKRSFAAVALASVTLPATTYAEVSNMDVWKIYQDWTAIYGGVLSADIETAGTSMTARNATAVLQLPMGFGAMTITMGDWHFRDNGDGTVTTSYDDVVDMTFAVTIGPNGALGEGSLAMQLRSDGYDMLASGTPDDITLSYDFPGLEMTMSDLSVSGSILEQRDFAAMAALKINGTISIAGNTGSTRLTRGDLFRIVGDYDASDLAYDFAFEGEHNVVATERGGFDGVSTSIDSAFLPGGVSVMAIPEALRDGMSISATSVSKNRVTASRVMVGDIEMTSSSDKAASSDVMLSLNNDGVDFTGGVTAFDLETTEMKHILPGAVSFAVDQLDIALKLPLQSSDTGQPVVLMTGLTGLSADERLWSVLDPEETLPRDPIDVTVDLAGTVVPKIDFLDVMALAALENSPELPVEIQELTVNRLDLAAGGATFTGSGGFTFDNADMTTFPGIPAPTGALDLRLTGGFGLMDTLAALGLLPEEQVMGARMMSGLFATPVGEDDLVSKIEIDGATGAISANGQRLQ